MMKVFNESTKLNNYIKAVHYGRRNGNVKGYMLQPYTVKQSRLIKPYDYVLVKACLKRPYYQAVAVNKELMVTTSFRWIETDYPEFITAVLNAKFIQDWIFFNTSGQLATALLWKLIYELPVTKLTEEELKWIKNLVTIRQSLAYDGKIKNAKSRCVTARARAGSLVELILTGFAPLFPKSMFVNFIDENKDLLK